MPQLDFVLFVSVVGTLWLTLVWLYSGLLVYGFYPFLANIKTYYIYLNKIKQWIILIYCKIKKLVRI